MTLLRWWLRQPRCERQLKGECESARVQGIVCLVSKVSTRGVDGCEGAKVQGIIVCPVQSTRVGTEGLDREGKALSSIPTVSSYRGRGQRPLPKEGPAPPSPLQTDGRTRGETVVETPFRLPTVPRI